MGREASSNPNFDIFLYLWVSLSFDSLALSIAIFVRVIREISSSVLVKLSFTNALCVLVSDPKRRSTINKKTLDPLSVYHDLTVPVSWYSTLIHYLFNMIYLFQYLDILPWSTICLTWSIYSSILIFYLDPLYV